jgi:hypothetical protein
MGWIDLFECSIEHHLSKKHHQSTAPAHAVQPSVPTTPTAVASASSSIDSQISYTIDACLAHCVQHKASRGDKPLDRRLQTLVDSAHSYYAEDGQWALPVRVENEHLNLNSFVTFSEHINECRTRFTASTSRLLLGDTLECQ